jgi:hypothetical protein
VVVIAGSVLTKLEAISALHGHHIGEGSIPLIPWIE